MNITHGLRRALQINPNGLAIVFGDRRRNWREVGDRVARLAAGIRALGAQAGDRVAILSLNSDRYLELYLAAGWAGTVIVPLNIRWSPLENEDAMRDCRAGILFVDKAFAAVGAALASAIPGLEADLCRRRRNARRHGELRGADRAQHADAGRDARERRSRRHLLHRRHHRPLQGRDAQPRQSDGQCAERARRRPVAEQRDLSARRADVSPRQRRGDVFAAAERRLQRRHPGASRRKASLGAIQSDRVTDVLLVPTMIQMLVDHPGTRQLRPVVAAGILPTAPRRSARRVLDRAMKALPERAVHAGLRHDRTVADRDACCTGRSTSATAAPRAGTAPPGAPRSAARCEIVDADDKPVPSGTVGEIAVRGDNVMMGYWERPEETARAVIDGWMHTGDGGYMDEDGFVYVVDRVKDMIISGGENVYSAEVENAHRPASRRWRNAP